MKKRIKQKSKGFTLIELLVVIAIIGLLASIVLVSTQGVREDAKNTKLDADLVQIQKAMEIARNTENKVLLQITGSACSLCACVDDLDLGSPDVACINSMTNAFQKIGLPLVKDPYGSPYLIDENELERPANPCIRDTYWSAGPNRSFDWGGDDIRQELPFYSSCF